MTNPAPQTGIQPPTPEKAPFEVLIDGECPLCKREAVFMAWLDGGRERLKLTDITEPAFDAGRYGTTFDEVMGSIHGVRASGEVIHGMEVFREAYRAVGWGWLLGWSAWPVFRPLTDAAYRVFARLRLRLTSAGSRCDDGRCRVPG